MSSDTRSAMRRIGRPRKPASSTDNQLLHRIAQAYFEKLQSHVLTTCLDAGITLTDDIRAIKRIIGQKLLAQVMGKRVTNSDDGNDTVTLPDVDTDTVPDVDLLSDDDEAVTHSTTRKQRAAVSDYQRRQRLAGLCVSCNRKAWRTGAPYCRHHHDKAIKRQRERNRAEKLRKGIPV